MVGAHSSVYYCLESRGGLGGGVYPLFQGFELLGTFWYYRTASFFGRWLLLVLFLQAHALALTLRDLCQEPSKYKLN